MKDDDMLYHNGSGKNAALRDESAAAPTIMFGQRSNAVHWLAGPDDASGPPVKVPLEEASAFQTYPDDFQWEGTKSKQYLQVGNAVPPLLAQVVLTTLWSTP